MKINTKILVACLVLNYSCSEAPEETSSQVAGVSSQQAKLSASEKDSLCGNNMSCGTIADEQPAMAREAIYSRSIPTSSAQPFIDYMEMHMNSARPMGKWLADQCRAGYPKDNDRYHVFFRKVCQQEIAKKFKSCLATNIDKNKDAKYRPGAYNSYKYCVWKYDAYNSVPPFVSEAQAIKNTVQEVVKSFCNKSAASCM